MKRLNTSYRQIVSISLPIMLGSAVQNVIALTDSVFLYHVSESDFAAIGLVGVFYLIIAAIGYSFSKGGQIIIARRAGEQRPGQVGRTFYALLYFALGLAGIMFCFMQYGGRPFFDTFVQSEVIFEKCIAYLEPRSYGVFFSYVGVCIIALYTGVARTSFIVIDTVILAVVNILLNYGLIYGKWGLPEMGIAGAGLASTIAEAVAFVVFAVYILFDRKARTYHLFRLPRVDLKLIVRIFKLSGPVVVQTIVGLGSWFVFFTFIEGMGERALAISNLARMVYLVLSIPCWGYASGINTLVSNFIGMQKRQVVVPIIWKTAKITLATTMAIALPIILFPTFFLYPLLGGGDMTLIQEARPVLYILLVILVMFSFGGIYFNGLSGTGATRQALYIQLAATLLYVLYTFVVVKVLQLNLVWVWSVEIAYWAVALSLTTWYLWSRRWYGTVV
ncbi:MAG: MATE family efflux transporter [Saprospiraceae bacterium]|nr:MATE family efflux transporter [Saprospiraceae bacterium]